MKQISDKAYKRFQAMCEEAGIEPVEEVKEKWEPPHQPYFFNQFGDIYKTTAHDYTDTGRERSTKFLCKIASDRTIRANRISAWLDSEGSGEQKYNSTETNYYILREDYNWIMLCSFRYYPDRVYMLKEDAIKFCKALNSGQMTL